MKENHQFLNFLQTRVREAHEARTEMLKRLSTAIPESEDDPYESNAANITLLGNFDTYTAELRKALAQLPIYTSLVLYFTRTAQRNPDGALLHTKEWLSGVILGRITSLVDNTSVNKANEELVLAAYGSSARMLDNILEG